MLLVLLGGVIGYDWEGLSGGANSIYCCYNTGNITVSQDVTGESYGAGIVAYMNSLQAKSKISDCINYGSITVSGNFVGGIVSASGFNTYVGEVINCLHVGTLGGSLQGSVLASADRRKLQKLFLYAVRLSGQVRCWELLKQRKFGRLDILRLIHLAKL